MQLFLVIDMQFSTLHEISSLIDLLNFSVVVDQCQFHQ